MKELITCKAGLCKKTIFRNRAMIFKNPREKGKMPKSCRDKMMQITYGRTQVTVIDVNLRARQPGYEPQPLFPNCKTLLTLPHCLICCVRNSTYLPGQRQSYADTCKNLAQTAHYRRRSSYSYENIRCTQDSETASRC